MNVEYKIQETDGQMMNVELKNSKSGVSPEWLFEKTKPIFRMAKITYSQYLK